MAEYIGSRRVPTMEGDRSRPQIGHKGLLKYDHQLNSDLDFIQNPYEKWRIKRNLVKNDLSKERPNYTQDELNKIYTAMNLDSSTSPGDFSREHGFFGSLSRAGSVAWNAAGSLVDVTQMKWADMTGDKEGVMFQQQQLEDSALETQLIQRFEEQSGDGKNAIAQFLFDVASSAPIMAGVMGVGMGLGALAGMAGAPIWLAGLLAYGVADSLTEMGFNYADIVTDPDVRKKMEDALGEKLNPASMEEIRVKVQEILMDQADSSAAKVGIGNFMNPLNFHPVAGKFSTLMKVGRGRVGTMGRQALGTGMRESIEEFWQSMGSQYTAAEAKMAGMEVAGVKEIPELEASWTRAGYEALMGLAVGGPIGLASGYKGYSDYASGKADVVEEGIGEGEGGFWAGGDKYQAKGELKYKKPGDKEFKGKGPLQFVTRRMVDANDPASFKVWHDTLKEDSRERKIVDDELKRMSEGEDLMGEKSSPEKLDQRKEIAKAYKKFLDTPVVEDTETTPEEAALDIDIEDSSVKMLYKETVRIPEESRTARQKIIVDVIKRNPKAKRADLNSTVHELEKALPTTPKAKPDKKPVSIQEDVRQDGKFEDEEGTTWQRLGKWSITTPPKDTTGAQPETKDAPLTPAPLTERDIRLREQARSGTPSQREWARAQIMAKGATERLEATGRTLEENEIGIIPAITRGTLNKKDTIQEVETLLKELSQGHPPSKYTPGEIHNLVLSEISRVMKGKERPRKAGETKDKQYDISYDDRVKIISNVSDKLDLTFPRKRQESGTTTPVEAEEVTGEEGFAEHGRWDEELQSWVGTPTEATPIIKTGKAGASNYDSTNTPLPIKVDDADVSQFINKIVVVETPLKSNKKSYVRVTTTPDAQTKTDREKLGDRTPTPGTPLKSLPLTRLRPIKFIGIVDRKIIFRDVKGGMNQDLTVPNLPVTKAPVSQATAENALRHLQTLEEKSFIGIKEKKIGKDTVNEAGSSYLTVYNTEELQQSAQAKEVLDRQNKLSSLEIEMETLQDEIEIAEKQKEIAKLRDELEALLPEKVRPQAKVKEGGPSTSERVPLNIVGKIQETINAKIRNIKKVFKENDKTLPTNEINRTLDDIEAHSPGNITFDRSGVHIYEDEDSVTTGKGKKKKTQLVKRLAMELPVTLDISDSQFMDVLRANGFDLIEGVGDGIATIRLSDVIPNLRGDPKYTRTFGTVEADIKAANKEYGENLGENLTRVYDPGRKDEPMASSIKETKQAEAAVGLEEKRAEPLVGDVIEDDVLAPQMRDKASKALSKYNQGLNKGMYKDKKHLLQDTKKAIDQLRETLPDKGEHINDEELAYHLWNNEGKKGFPVIKSIGGTSSKSVGGKLGINNYETALKDKKGVVDVYTPSWNTHQKHYDTLAAKISKPKGRKLTAEAAPSPRAKGKPKAEPKAEVKTEPKTEVKAETPVTPPVVEEVVTKPEPKEVSPIITIAELSNPKVLPGDKDGAWTKIITSDEKAYYQDVSTWDARAYEREQDWHQDIKDDLPGSKSAPKGLTTLIRNRMVEWLVGRVQTEEDIESLKAEIEERFWPILTKPNRDIVNAAIAARGSAILDRNYTIAESAMKKTEAVKKKSKLGEPTQEPAPKPVPSTKAGFISDNAISAKRYVPTKNPSVPEVWYIHPDEVDNIFNEHIKPGQLIDYEAFVEQDFPLGFEVVHKGKQWYILRLTGEGQRVTEEGKIDKMEVPTFIKDVLTKKGKETFGADKPPNRMSYKIPPEELRNRETTSEIYVNLNREINVLDELNKAHHDQKRIKYARVVPGNEESVEVYWMNEDFVSLDEKGNQLRGFITFESKGLAQRFVKDIKNGSPLFDKIENQYEVDLINKHIIGGKEGLLNSVISDVKESDILGKNLTTANVELLDPLSRETDPALDAEPGELVDPSPYELDPISTPLWNPEEAKKSRDQEVKSLKEAYDNDETLNYSIPKDLIHTTPLARERVEEIISEYQKEFPGSAPVTVLSDTEVAELLGTDPKGDIIQGMYWKGRVWIVPSNIISDEEVLTVLWHENVGHLGVENMMNYQSEEGFRGFINEMVRDFPEEIRAMREYDWDLHTKYREAERKIINELEGKGLTYTPTRSGYRMTDKQGKRVKPDDMLEHSKRSKAFSILRKKHVDNQIVAVKEFIAHHADNLFKDSPPGLFEKIARIIRRILRNLSNRFGIGHVRKSEEEIKHILRGVADSFRTGDTARKGTFLATELLHSNLIKVLEKGKNLPKETTIENWRKHLARLNKSGIINDVEWQFSGIMDTLDILIEEAQYKYDMEAEDFVYDSWRDAANQEIVTRSELIFQLKRYIESSYPYRVTSSDEYSGGMYKPDVVNKTQHPEVKRIHDTASRIINDWLLKYHNPNAEKGEGDTARLEALEKERTDEGPGDYDHDEVYKFRLIREDWRVAAEHPETDWKYSFTVKNQYQEDAIDEAVPSELDQGDWGEDGIPDDNFERQYQDAENRISLVSGRSQNLGNIVETVMQELRIAEWKGDNTNPDGSFDVAAFEEFMEDMPERRGWQGTHETGYSERWNNLSPTEKVLIDNIDNALGRFWTKTREAIETKRVKGLSLMRMHESNFPDVEVYEQKSYKIPALVKSFVSEGHMGVPGEFMHTRTGIFSNEKGEKIFLLGEVQSDLHQRAKEDEDQWKKELREKREEGYFEEHGVTEESYTRAYRKEDSRVLSLAKDSPFGKTWQKKAVFFELKHALSDPTIDYFVFPTGEMVRGYTAGKLSGQVQWYEKVLPKALSDLVKPLGVEVEKISIPGIVQVGARDVNGDLIEEYAPRVDIEVSGVDLRKIRAKGGVPSQPLFYKTQRPTLDKNSFNRTSLPAEAEESWNQMYDTEAPESPSGSWWHDIRRSLVSRWVDPYRNIKEDIGMEQYMVTRLAKRGDGVFATILRHIGVKVEKRNINGVLVNETVLDSKVKGLFDIMKPLGTEIERKQFVAFIAYSRADKLMGEGKEHRFTKDHIKQGLLYNEGMMRDATTGAMMPRKVVYEKVRKDLMDLNKSVVKIGIDMGLLSKTAGDNFEQEYYMPFYRVIEEEFGKTKGGNITDYNSLTGQVGVKKLKGSGKPLGDPFNNLLHNWLHIIDASLKNDAAVTTIRSALTIQDPMDSSQMMVTRVSSPSTRSLRVLEGGKEKFYNINNKLLYQSLASLGPETKFPGMKGMIWAKGLFTKIITANPVFKINNIVRDTVSAAGTSDIGFNLIKNAWGGFRSLSKLEAQMLVSGGYIQFVHTRADDPNYAETLLKKELSSGYLLTNPESDETFLSALKKAKHMGANLWDKYSKVGDKMENANRAALFAKLIEGGKSQTEAGFEARDLMDFTLHGGSDWVRMVTSLTPFANAMLQGKYKIGRSVINNPKPVAIVAALVMLASLYEEMLFEDDEEYQARPDWDKDSYWWVKIPGTDTIFKVPKPHEFSMVGNLAWRSLKLAEEQNPEYGKALASGVRAIVSREFGIVPLPQAIKPLIELGMNVNLFFDRDIEPMGSRGLSPSLRYGQYTSETAILASQILEYSPIDKLKLSPYQLEHLIRGYFDWGGEMVLGVADMLTRTTGDFPERPARKLMDYPMARRLFKTSPIRNTKAATVFYKRLQEMEQAVQDLNFARKLHNWDRAREIYERDKDLLRYKAFMRKKARSVNDFNARIKVIKNDMHMGGNEKAVMMDRLYQLRNELISKIVKTPAFR